MLRLIVIDVAALAAEGSPPLAGITQASKGLDAMRGPDGSPLATAFVCGAGSEARALAEALPARHAARSAILLDGDGLLGARLAERYGISDPAADCLAVSAAGTPSTAIAALGCPVLPLEQRGADTGWRSLLVRIAQRTGPRRADNMAALLSEFARADGIDNPLPDPMAPGFRVTGQSWLKLDDAALGPLSGIHVQVPASLSLTDPDGARPEIASGVEEDARQEAIAFVRSLAAHGQIETEGGAPVAAADLRPEEAPPTRRARPFPGRPTHYVETDEAGRRLLQRRGFS